MSDTIVPMKLQVTSICSVLTAVSHHYSPKSPRHVLYLVSY